MIDNQNNLMYFFMRYYLENEYAITFQTHPYSSKYSFKNFDGRPFFSSIVTPKIKACYFENDKTLTWVEDADGNTKICKIK